METSDWFFDWLIDWSIDRLISDIFKEGSRDQWTNTALYKGHLYNNINKIHYKYNLDYKIQIL